MMLKVKFCYRAINQKALKAITIVKRLLNSHQKLISRKILHIIPMSKHIKQNHWKDLETFRNISLSTEFTSLQKIFQFSFILVNGLRRKFNSKWLKDFSWLAYPLRSDEGFCKYLYTTAKILFSEAPLREKCPNTDFFLVRIFPHSDLIWRDTPYLSVFSPNTGKCGPQKSPYLDTFHAVHW